MEPAEAFVNKDTLVNSLVQSELISNAEQTNGVYRFPSLIDEAQ